MVEVCSDCIGTCVNVVSTCHLECNTCVLPVTTHHDITKICTILWPHFSDTCLSVVGDPSLKDNFIGN